MKMNKTEKAIVIGIVILMATIALIGLTHYARNWNTGELFFCSSVCQTIGHEPKLCEENESPWNCYVRICCFNITVI